MMNILAHTFAEVRRNQRGSMVIETAIVAPVLIILAVGGFESSRIVARQTELQTAAAEAAAIVRAAPPETAAERTTVRDVVKSSVGLNDSNVTIVEKFRCGAATTVVSSKDDCVTGETVSTYIELVITDSYTPTWTDFGIGERIDYRVERLVFIS